MRWEALCIMPKKYTEAAEQLRKIDGWYSIHDNPPKDGSRVLALIGSISPRQPIDMVVVRWDEIARQWISMSNGVSIVIASITHWHALPSRPRVL
jgi:hypothetical protein